MATYAQEETVIDQKGTRVTVRNTVVTTAATAPGNPLQNDVWFDSTAELTKIYDGTVWLTINLDALAKKENSANKSTDTNLSDATNTKFPTELAVKTYVATELAAVSADNIYTVDGTLSANRAVTQNNFDLNFDVNTLVVSGDDNRVGIGTASPNGKLHLYETTGTLASANTGTMVLEHENSGGTSSIVFKSKVNAGSDYGYIQFSDDGSGNGSTTENGLLEIGIQNDVVGPYQDDIALMPSGSVGIGTRAPSDKLHVAGNLRINGALKDKDGDVGTTGQVLASTATGTDWISISTGGSSTNYGARWTNSNTSTDVNNNITAPIFGTVDYKDDTGNSLYEVSGNTLIVKESGRYDIRVNLAFRGIDGSGTIEQNTNVNSILTVNGSAKGALAASGYISFLSGHDHSSIHINEILQLNANDVVSIVNTYEANVGVVRFSASNESSFTINKIK